MGVSLYGKKIAHFQSYKLVKRDIVTKESGVKILRYIIDVELEYWKRKNKEHAAASSMLFL
ncbi:hypothetical protein MFLO_09237 [Listeria floridensis FSL S10-1187]|uniref:Uncharacterized protein n=1 Tax=Listeria floridensis FSL S10-1187 TaxID=1265817 RepID=A0ABP3AXP4_9LIST|nr:hypothetical protein MFLO_09237 [Listeria floridensis FSL S10-1187]